MNVAPTSFILFYCTVYTVYHNKNNPMMLEKDNEERRPAAYFLFGKFVK